GRLLQLATDAAWAVSAGPNSAGAATDDRRAVLTLLTYCYASGILASREIEWNCANNSTIQSICGDAPPEWLNLLRFRNANRPWIEESLARVYRAVMQATAADVAPGPDTQSGAPRAWVEFARVKVRQAARADSENFE